MLVAGSIQSDRRVNVRLRRVRVNVYIMKYENVSIGILTVVKRVLAGHIVLVGGGNGRGASQPAGLHGCESGEGEKEKLHLG